MITPPSPDNPQPPYVGLTIDTFLSAVLRAYPDAVENVANKLCQDPVIRRAFHYYMVTEHYSGLKISQRGVTYYITRASNIRGTSGYETYTNVKWQVEEQGGTPEENPKYSYCLFSDKWYGWVTVPH